MTPFHLGRKSSSISTMPKVLFLFLSLTVIYKTGSFPIPPTGNVLASASCLLDYCCMMFESTARPILEEEVDLGDAEGPGHLPERRRSLLTMSSEGRLICKGSINIDIVQRPKDSQMLCRRMYDQHNSAWLTQCRFSTNRRPQEEDATLMTKPQEEAAPLQSRVRPFERKSRLISKLVSQRSTSTTAIDDYHHPWLVESSRRKIRTQPEDSLKSVNGGEDSGDDAAANALSVYRLWRDANGYGKQKARWGRSSKTHSSWRRSSPADEQRKTTKQRRRNEATEEEDSEGEDEGLILSRSFSRADRRQVSNSTADKTRDWIVRDRPELDAFLVPYLAAASGLFDAAPAAAAAGGAGGGGGAAAGGGVEEPNVNGNVLRRKRTRLDRSSRLSSSGDVFSSEAKYVLEGYLDWRSKNGYGKLAGRWG